MKTRGLLSVLPLLLMSMMGSSKNALPTTSAPNGYIGGGSPIFISQPKKFKGYMREYRRTDRGHGYNKRRIAA